LRAPRWAVDVQHVLGVSQSSVRISRETAAIA